MTRMEVHASTDASPAGARPPAARRQSRSTTRRQPLSIACRGSKATGGTGSVWPSRSAAAELIASPRGPHACSIGCMSRGAEPFVIPAMGSHGGATPEGQRELLASYGITSDALGVPVDAEMETDEVGRTPSGIPVQLRGWRARRTPSCSSTASSRTPISRAHARQRPAEDGRDWPGQDATAPRRATRGAARLGYETALAEVAQAVLACTPRLYGVGLLEDGTHQLARLEVLRGDEIAREEPALLQQARAWMPALPFAEVDVLVVDAIGKNISGAGMDPNIIGRGVHGERMPMCRSTVRDHLRPRPHARVARQRHRDRAGRRRVITARGRDGSGGHLHQRARRDEDRAGAHPVPVRDGRGMPPAAFRLAGVAPERARILRIRDTLALERGHRVGELPRRDRGARRSRGARAARAVVLEA